VQLHNPGLSPVPDVSTQQPNGWFMLWVKAA
jgi:hypothetical protein